jgi:hypothetical protein
VPGTKYQEASIIKKSMQYLTARKTLFGTVMMRSVQITKVTAAKDKCTQKIIFFP